MESISGCHALLWWFIREHDRHIRFNWIQLVIVRVWMGELFPRTKSSRPMVYLWYLVGILKRATTMNTTTFTIESVHGVKQTFVLGPPAKTTPSGPPKNKPTKLEREADSKGISAASRSRR